MTKLELDRELETVKKHLFDTLVREQEQLAEWDVPLTSTNLSVARKAFEWIQLSHIPGGDLLTFSKEMY